MAPPFPKTTMPYPSTWCPSSGPTIPGGWIYGDVLAATASCRSCTPATCDNQVQAAAPTFDPPAGEYEFPFVLFLSSTTPGATIYYTIDGSEPSDESLLYTDAGIVLLAGTTVKAIAYADGYLPSDVSSAEYDVLNPRARAPILSPDPGTYFDTQFVTITSPDGGDIHYTIDGSTPTIASPIYTTALTVGFTTTIKAIAIVTDFTDSSVTTGVYDIEAATVATPVFAPPPGTFTGEISITITCATPGALIYYTIIDNGGGTPPDPTPADILYTGPILEGSDTKIKARAYKTGLTQSGIAAGHWTPIATTDILWGSSTNPLITDAAEWDSGPGSPFTELFEITEPITNRDLGFLASPPDSGSYRYIVMLGTSEAPAAVGGFKQNGFNLNFTDLAGIADGFTSVDDNGWPYYSILRAGDGELYRQYRLVNQLFGAFTITLNQ